MECLDTEVLCLHMNNELDTGTQQRVAAHLNICQSCADRLRTMQEHEVVLRDVFSHRRSRQARGQSCYSAQELSAYASGALAPQEVEQFEEHLLTCEFCLGEVMAMRRMRRLLKHTAPLTPPVSLVTTARR